MLFLWEQPSGAPYRHRTGTPSLEGWYAAITSMVHTPELRQVFRRCKLSVSFPADYTEENGFPFRGWSTTEDLNPVLSLTRRLHHRKCFWCMFRPTFAGRIEMKKRKEALRSRFHPHRREEVSDDSLQLSLL